MTNEEIQDHFEYIDGVQKGQTIALSLIYKLQPELQEKLKEYMQFSKDNDLDSDLSDIQKKAMNTFLQGICKN